MYYISTHQHHQPLQKVRLYSGECLPTLLLANKWDLVRRKLDVNVMSTYCEENGFLGWFCTSAKNGLNISESMECLLSQVHRNLKKEKEDADLQQEERNRISLTSQTSLLRKREEEFELKAASKWKQCAC